MSRRLESYNHALLRLKALYMQPLHEVHRVNIIHTGEFLKVARLFAGTAAMTSSSRLKSRSRSLSLNMRCFSRSRDAEYFEVKAATLESAADLLADLLTDLESWGPLEDEVGFAGAAKRSAFFFRNLLAGLKKI